MSTKGVQERVAALRPNPVNAIGRSLFPFVLAILLATLMDKVIGPAAGPTWAKILLDVGIAILLALYLCFGLGNGATFQLVPNRWKGKAGIMTGIIGAAGGIGGFYLPVIMGLAKESTGSYQAGFATFGILAAIAFTLVIILKRQWLSWAVPEESAPMPDLQVVHAE